MGQQVCVIARWWPRTWFHLVFSLLFNPSIRLALSSFFRLFDRLCVARASFASNSYVGGGNRRWFSIFFLPFSCFVFLLIFFLLRSHLSLCRSWAFFSFSSSSWLFSLVLVAYNLQVRTLYEGSDNGPVSPNFKRLLLYSFEGQIPGLDIGSDHRTVR